MRVIGPPLSPAETTALVAHARSMVGVRFRHRGRSARGVDCVGLIAVALVEIRRPIADVASYGREPHEDKLRETLVANMGEPVDKSSMRVGDVAMMKFEGEPSHVGLIADYVYGGLSLIHSYAMVCKVVEHRIDADWHARILEVFRP